MVRYQQVEQVYKLKRHVSFSPSLKFISFSDHASISQMSQMFLESSTFICFGEICDYEDEYTLLDQHYDTMPIVEIFEYLDCGLVEVEHLYSGIR